VLYDPDEVQVLKYLALSGAMDDFIPVSSGELGRDLGVSQQTASRRILDLLDKALIQRELGARRQLIRLTEDGMKALQSEYADYVSIFEVRDRVTLRGSVVSGLGEGRYYIEQNGYRDQFRELLDMDPYVGTLNIRLTGEDRGKVQLLRRATGIPLRGFTQGSRTFGAVKAFNAILGDLRCAVVMPQRSHHMDTIEIISEHQLRKLLDIRDGDVVELQVILATPM
jgi:riboflavin kinase